MIYGLLLINIFLVLVCIGFMAMHNEEMKEIKFKNKINMEYMEWAMLTFIKDYKDKDKSK